MFAYEFQPKCESGDRIGRDDASVYGPADFRDARFDRRGVLHVDGGGVENGIGRVFQTFYLWVSLCA